MVKVNKRKLLIVALIAVTAGSAHAEMSNLHKQVIADNATMNAMNAEERRDFRKQIWNNSDKVVQRAYNRAYKEMVEAGLISHTKKSSGKAANTQAQRVPLTSISYHSGAMTPSALSSVTVGNRFDIALNQPATGLFPVEVSGSITKFTVDMASVDAGVFLSVYDNLAGTTANQVTSMSVPGLITGFNSVTLATALNYTGGEVLAGIWNFGGDAVNVATGTVGGQGFHAIQINDGNPGNGFATIANMNVAFGLSGDLTTPVELMNFSID